MPTKAEIAALKDRVDARLIVGQFVQLKAATSGRSEGLCPFHTEKSPSFMVERDHFHCFGCGAHGDVFEFLERSQKMGFVDSWKLLSGQEVREGRKAKGPAKPNGAAGAHQRAASAAWEALPAVPADAPPMPAHGKHGPPDHEYVYRHADGSAAFVVMRWDASETRPKKILAQLTWCRGPDGREEWRWQGPKDGRVPYDLPAVAASADAPGLIVEGEKAHAAAKAMCPPGWVVTTWAGGAQAIERTDWSVLAGRRWLVWPDCDDEGIGAALTLRAIGSMVGAVSIAIVDPRKLKLPPKWDLAEPLPENVTADRVRDLMVHAIEGRGPFLIGEATASRPAVAKAPPRVVVEVVPDRAPMAREDGFEEAGPERKSPVPLPAALGGEAGERFGKRDYDEYIQALGHAEGTYYFLVRKSRSIQGFTSKALLTTAPYKEMFASGRAWTMGTSHWRTDNKRVEKVDYEAAAGELIERCYHAGYFDLGRVRGRGVWRDGTHVVVNLGNSLLVDGQRREVTDFRGRYWYPQGPSLMDPGEAATVKEGQQLLNVCRLLPFTRRLHGDLFAGWMYLSLICGALDWRAHVWIMGPSGSGKSTTISDVVQATLRENAFYVEGKSSEAGIRSTLQGAALPVIFDEAEQPGAAGRQRIQAVLDLMRVSSSEGPGGIVMGSSSHSPVEFRVRSSFCLTSISIPDMRPADESRCVVMTYEPVPDKAAKRAVEARQERFRQLQAALAGLESDFGPKLFARAIRDLPTIRHNIQQFRRAVAAALGNNRYGDTIGSLIGGSYSLCLDGQIDFASAEKLVKRMDLGEWTRDPNDTREDLLVLSHIMAMELRVKMADKTLTDRTAGELVAFLANLSADDLDRREAELALRRHGLSVDDKREGVWISNNNQHLRRILRNSEYPEGHHMLLRQHAEARASDRPVSFSRGDCSRATWLPLRVCVPPGSLRSHDLSESAEPEYPLPIYGEDDAPPL